MAYGTIVYLLSVAVLAYTIGFVLDLFVPRTVNVGPARPVTTAVLGNLALLSLFGLQHSVMARPAFKRLLCRFVPAPVERSTYCLATCVALALLFFFWSPIDGTIWEVTTPWAATALRVVACSGFCLLLIASFQLHHFELFGLVQPWRALKERPTPEPSFRMPALYKHMRHPIYTGMLMGIWSTATMTSGHLLFAGVSTAYILVGSTLEEMDLVKTLGSRYRLYQNHVSRLVPIRSLLRGGGAPHEPS